MSESLLFRVHLDQLHAFEEAIEAGKQEAAPWKRPEDQVRGSRDAEGVARTALQIPATLNVLWQSTLDLAAAGGIDDYEKAGAKLRQSFETGLRILGGVQGLLQAFIDAGIQVCCFTELTEAILAVRQLETRVFESWPQFSAGDVEQAQAEHMRGESVELDAAFASLAGCDVDAWRKRVEEHRRAC